MHLVRKPFETFLREGVEGQVYIFLEGVPFCPSPELLFFRGKHLRHCIDAQRGEEGPLEIVFGSFSYLVPKCLLVFKLLLIFPIIDFGDRQDLQC